MTTSQMDTVMQSLYDYKKFAILYVDDEEKSLKYFARAFEDQFRIFTAANAQDGLKILEAHQDEIGLLMTDQRMPGEQGLHARALSADAATVDQAHLTDAAGGRKRLAIHRSRRREVGPLCTFFGIPRTSASSPEARSPSRSGRCRSS